jgi:dTDP-4-amino-4,6-dideoxygalactose transaminase
MLIRQTPSFSLKEIFTNGRTDIDVYPLNSKNTHLFFGARYAIWAGIKAFSITADQNILMPSYNCGTEIDPILDQGIQVKYYRVKRNMVVEVEDIRTQIDPNSAAVFLIHYMGIPQPIEEIKQLCEENGLYLIEDCAHAFLSTYNSKPLGTFGDFSVFSIRKTLPIPNGGALVLNNEKAIFNEKLKKGGALSSFFVAIELLNNKTHQDHPGLFENLIDMIIGGVAFLNKIFQLFLRIIRKISPYKGLSLVQLNYYCREFKRDIVLWEISTLSKRIMGNVHYDQVKEKRRANFEYLLQNLPKTKEIEIVFKTLPAGACPLFFPLIVKDRSFYYQKLKDQNITVFNYWRHLHDAVPWDKFPEAVFLKEHVLGLPVHQDINFNHLDKILKVLTS